MIFGIVGSAPRDPEPPDPYSGALVVMDFENGVYRVNGASVDVSTLINQPELIVGGELVLDYNVIPAVLPVALLSPVYSNLDFTTGFTAFIEFVQYEIGGNYKILAFWNGVGSNPGKEWFEIQDYDGKLYTYSYLAVAPDYTYREVFGSHTAVNGERRKIAVTWAIDHLSGSEAGTPAITDTTAGSTVPAFTSYALGNYATAPYIQINARVKKLIFYPPKSDADLPALTV